MQPTGIIATGYKDLISNARIHFYDEENRSVRTLHSEYTLLAFRSIKTETEYHTDYNFATNDYVYLDKYFLDNRYGFMFINRTFAGINQTTHTMAIVEDENYIDTRMVKKITEENVATHQIEAFIPFIRNPLERRPRITFNFIKVKSRTYISSIRVSVEISIGDELYENMKRIIAQGTYARDYFT